MPQEKDLYSIYTGLQQRGLHGGVEFEEWVNLVKNSKDFTQFTNKQAYKMGMTNDANPNRWATKLLYSYESEQKSKQDAVNKQKEIESLAKTKVNESNQIQQEKRNQQILEEQAKVFEPTEPITQFPTQKTGVVAEYEKAIGEPIKQVEKKEQPKKDKLFYDVKTPEQQVLYNATKLVKGTDEEKDNYVLNSNELRPLFYKAIASKYPQLKKEDFEVKNKELIDVRTQLQQFGGLYRGGEKQFLSQSQSKKQIELLEKESKLERELQNSNKNKIKAESELATRTYPFIKKAVEEGKITKKEARGTIINSQYIPDEDILVNGKPISLDELNDISYKYSDLKSGKYDIKVKLNNDNDGWNDNKLKKSIVKRINKNANTGKLKELGLGTIGNIVGLADALPNALASFEISLRGGKKVSPEIQKKIRDRNRIFEDVSSWVDEKSGEYRNIEELIADGEYNAAGESLLKGLSQQVPIVIGSVALSRFGVPPSTSAAIISGAMGYRAFSDTLEEGQTEQSLLYDKFLKGEELSKEESDDLWRAESKIYANSIGNGLFEWGGEYLTAKIANKYIQAARKDGMTPSQIAKNLTQNFISGAKEVGIDILEENAAEMFTSLGQRLTSSITLGKDFDEGLIKELKETVIQTTFSTSIMAGGGKAYTSFKNKQYVKQAVAPEALLNAVNKISLNEIKDVLNDKNSSEVAKTIAKNNLKELNKDLKASRDGFYALDNKEQANVIELMFRQNEINKTLKKQGISNTEKELLTKEQEKINSEIEIISEKANEIVKEKIKSEKEIQKVEEKQQEVSKTDPIVSETNQAQEVVEAKEDTPSPTKEWNIEKPQPITEESKVVEEISPVEDKVVETKIPSDEQQFKDVQNGDVVTFKYDNENEVPDVFKEKISSISETNGVKTIRVTVAKSLADYHLQVEESESQKNQIPSIKENESPQREDIIPNAEVRPTTLESEQQRESKDVQSTFDSGEVKGDVEVKENIKKVKSLKDITYDVSLDENGIVTKIINPTNGKEIKKFTTRISPKTKKEVVVKNANYARIEADAYGTTTKGKDVQLEKQSFNEAMQNFTPTNEYEVALEALANGQKVSAESLVLEIGHDDSSWATNKSSKEKLNTIEALSEILHSNYPHLDQTEIRNELINIIGSNSSLDDVKQKIVETKLENNKKLQEQELFVYLNGLSEKDLALYESITAEDEYISELTDEQAIEYYEEEYKKRQEQQDNDKVGTIESPSVQKRDGEKKEQTSLEKAQEKRKLLKAKIYAKRGISSFAQDSKQDAQDLYDYHQALVEEAKEYIKLGVKTLNDFAKKLGEKVSVSIKLAWDEANGDIKPILNADDLNYDFDTFNDVVEEKSDKKEDSKTDKFEKLNITEKEYNSLRDKIVKTPVSDEDGVYLSKETKEGVFKEELRNDQSIKRVKLSPLAIHGQEVLEMARDIFGDNYVSKTLDFLFEADLDTFQKGIIYATLENEMDTLVKENPENNSLRKLQDAIYKDSQANLRIGSLTINTGRVIRIVNAIKLGIDIEKTTSMAYTQKQKEAKRLIDNSLPTPENINKIDEEENKTYTQKEFDEALEKIKKDLEIVNLGFEIRQTKVKIKKEEALAQIQKIKDSWRKSFNDNTLMITVPYAKQLIAVTPDIIKLANIYRQIAGMKTIDIIEAIKVDVSDVFDAIKESDIKAILKKEFGVKVKKTKESTQRNAYIKLLKSNIESLDEQISEKKRKVVTKEDKYKNDAEINDLRVIRDAKKEELKKIAPNYNITKKDVKTSNIVKQALIDAGFSRDVKISKTGEVKKYLDWRKLFGREGTKESLRRNVEEQLKKQGKTDSEIAQIQVELEAEYKNLSEKILEKAMKDLENRNLIKPSPHRKSHAKKLVDLYEQGLFGENFDKYENVVNRILGFSKIQEKQYIEIKEQVKALADLYSRKEGGETISELGLRTVSNEIKRKINTITFKAVVKDAPISAGLQLALEQFLYFSQKALLGSIRTLGENRISGEIAIQMSDLITGKYSTKELNKLIKESKKMVKQDMNRHGGLSYGDTSMSLLTHSVVDDIANEKIKSQIGHRLYSFLTLKAYLDTVDSGVKARLTLPKFVRNAAKILMTDSNERKGMSRQDALKFISEALTGDNFEKALETAKNIIDETNKGKEKKILRDNKEAIHRFAMDLVLTNLNNNNIMTLDQIEASFKASFRSAGASIGHEANNYFTRMINRGYSDLSARREKAITERRWTEAVGLSMTGIFIKLTLFPFAGGGANWIFIGAEKGVPLWGIATATYLKAATVTKIDLNTETGKKSLEETLYNENVYKDTAVRGFYAVGMALIAYITMLGYEEDEELTNAEKLNKWLRRKENKWLQPFFYKLSPIAFSFIIAQESGNKEISKYLMKLFSLGDDYYDKKVQFLRSIGNKKRGSTKAATGALLAEPFNTPIGWKTAKDIENFYRGINGLPPFKSTNEYKTFGGGMFKGGAVEYMFMRDEDKKSE